MRISAGAVSDHIVEMSVYIKIGKLFKIFQYGFEIFPVGFLLGTSFVKAGIVGIASMAYVGGADDEIKFVGFCIDGIFSQDFGLQSQLHTEQKTHFTGVFLL